MTAPFTRGLLVLQLLMLCGSAVVAAAPASEEFVVRTWQTEDGLPQNSGTALVQTTDGYLWVGTFNGLVRFNGVEFLRFTMANTKELPSDDINTLYEDRAGRLWIGTFTGLVRYERGRFKAWRSPDKLGQANVRRIAQRPDGAVIVTTDRGVWLVKDDQASELVIPDAEWTTYASLVACSQDGRVWVSHREKIFRLAGDQLLLETRLEKPIGALAVARDGTLWCEQGGGVFRIQPGNSPPPTKFGIGSVRAFCQTSNGDWWFAGHDNGLHRWRDGQVVSITTAEGLPSNRLLALTEDREGSLWVGTDGGGFCRISRKQLATLGIEHGLSHNDVISVVQDRQGRMWLGTFGGALCVGTNGQWRPYLAPGILATNDAVISLCQTRDDTLWIGRKGPPLLRLRNDRLEVEPHSRVGTVRALFEDSNGRLWIGSDNHGVECFRGDQVDRWSITNGLSNNFITAFAEDASGAVWIGTGHGLNRLADGTIRTFFDKDGLGLNQIHSLFIDRSGVLWIGTAGGGLTRFQNGRFATVTSRQGLHGDVVAQILEDDDGSFWIGSTIGIFRVAVQSLHDVLDGRSPFVRCSAYGRKDGMGIGGCPGGFQPTCLRTPDGRLWFGTSGGLTVVDPRTVQRSGLPPPVHVERLVVDGVEIGRGTLNPLASGIPPNWGAAHAAPSSPSSPREERAGRGWRRGGTNKNEPPLPNPLLHLMEEREESRSLMQPWDAANAPRHEFAAPAPITASSNRNVTGFEKPAPGHSRIEPLQIPPGAKRLEFHCAALSFNSPEQAQFRFWLEGYEDNWQEGGSRRVAYYSQVPPGNYRFHAQAANSDGVWNETGAAVAVLIRSTWRQTWWYRSALVLSGLGVLAALYYRRVSALKTARSQQTSFSRRLLESQEAERKRISSELHDSLGQSLLIIKNRASRSLQGLTAAPAVETELREISQVAADALEEVRSIARALRPFQLDVFGLSRAVRSLVQQVAEANGLEFELDIDSLDSLLPPESEISLYRIVQESLNNVVKHAKASRVRVTAQRLDDTVCLTVEDDGCGFDRASVRSPGAGLTGQGLAGMEQRVHLLNGRLEIGRRPAGGTRLAVKLPMQKSRPS